MPISRSNPVPAEPRLLKPVIEALIFASEDPLPPRTLVRLLLGEKEDEPEQRETGSADDPGNGQVDARVVEPELPDMSDTTVETTFPDEAMAPSDAPVQAEPVPFDEPGAGPRTANLDHQDEAASSEDTAAASVDMATEPFSARLDDRDEVAVDQRLVRRLIEELNVEYDETGRAFRIVEVAGGFQFATMREYGEYVALLSKEKQRRRLSPAALETLSIIAYRQPIAKPEIEAIRGVNSDQVLLSLLEKNLVAITGRSESVGRPLLYGTTDDFLRAFGLNSLNDLPKLREIEELMEEDAYSAEKIDVVTVSTETDAADIEALVGAAGGMLEERGIMPAEELAAAVNSMNLAHALAEREEPSEEPSEDPGIVSDSPDEGRPGTDGSHAEDSIPGDTTSQS